MKDVSRTQRVFGALQWLSSVQQSCPSSASHSQLPLHCPVVVSQNVFGAAVHSALAVQGLGASHWFVPRLHTRSRSVHSAWLVHVGHIFAPEGVAVVPSSKCSLMSSPCS